MWRNKRLIGLLLLWRVDFNLISFNVSFLLLCLGVALFRAFGILDWVVDKSLDGMMNFANQLATINKMSY